MIINKTILNLNQIIGMLTYTETIEYCNEISDYKNSLHLQLIKLKALRKSFQPISDIIAIEEQLIYINENISILKKALNIFEQKVKEEKYINGQIITFFNN